MFILASQSPRRRDLLHMLGLDFTIVTADIDETMDKTLPVEDAVCLVCEKKAAAVGALHPDSLIVAADTVVVVDGQVLGKPAGAGHAKEMLCLLSGRSHEVLTAFCLWRGGVVERHVERTEIRFKPLSEEEIEAYVATGSPLDKAGAYGIQEQAGIFVESIHGDYYNVMGLPLCALVKSLRRQGVTVLGTVQP